MRQQGFSLIEMVMVVVLMGIISVVVGGMLLNTYQTFITSENVNEVDWNAMALNRLVNDVHMIRSQNDISSATATQLTFVNIAGSTVSYTLSGSTLLRNGITLATGVQSFALGYLQSNGAATSTTSQIRYVTASMTLVEGNLSSTFATTAGTRGMP